MLLLHADTIFESKRARVSRPVARGRDYRLDELIEGQGALPSRVQLVWHGVNDEANLRQMLASTVRWAEVDARLERGVSDPIVRADGFETMPPGPSERWLSLAEVIGAIASGGRAIKLDLKTGGELIERVIELVRARGMRDEDLWLNGRIEVLGEAGFRRLREAFPGATLQCPADFAAPLVLALPEEARVVLERLRGWGIDRFSLSWDNAQLRELVSRMDEWHYDVNLYRVPDPRELPAGGAAPAALGDERLQLPGVEPLRSRPRQGRRVPRVRRAAGAREALIGTGT